MLEEQKELQKSSGIKEFSVSRNEFIKSLIEAGYTPKQAW